MLYTRTKKGNGHKHHRHYICQVNKLCLNLYDSSWVTGVWYIYIYMYIYIYRSPNGKQTDLEKKRYHGPQGIKSAQQSVIAFVTLNVSFLTLLIDNQSNRHFVCNFTFWVRTLSLQPPNMRKHQSGTRFFFSTSQRVTHRFFSWTLAMAARNFHLGKFVVSICQR